MKQFLLTTLVLLTSIRGLPAAPHQVGQSYVILSIFDQRIEGRVEIHYPDLEDAMSLSRPVSKAQLLEHLQGYRDAIYKFALDRLVIRVDEQQLVLREGELSLLGVGLDTFVQVNFDADLPAGRPNDIEVNYRALFDLNSDHRAFAVIENDWRKGTISSEAGALLLTPDDHVQSFDLKGGSLLTGFAAMVRLGTWHIWIGIDHILFLLALLLPAVVRREENQWVPVAKFRTALWNLLKIVSMFTLAHTATLSLAAFQIIQLPGRLVESVIAASIIIVAIHNIYPIIPGRDWIIAFVFGLFHGFGFASVLGHLGVATEHALLSLLGFNLGVEIGQIAVVAVAFPILFLARKSRWYPRFLVLGSWLLVAVASVWLVERLLDLDLWQPVRRLSRSVGRRIGLI